MQRWRLPPEFLDDVGKSAQRRASIDIGVVSAPVTEMQGRAQAAESELEEAPVELPGIAENQLPSPWHTAASLLGRVGPRSAH